LENINAGAVIAIAYAKCPTCSALLNLVNIIRQIQSETEYAILPKVCHIEFELRIEVI
jgi:hypothetical protein